MNKKTSHKIALSGIMASLCIVVMFMAGVVPAFQYICPSVAGMLVWVISREINKKWALLCYLAVGILSMMFTTDWESKMLFVLLLGYYPILRVYLHKVRVVPLRLLLKLALFNGTAILAYVLIISLGLAPDVLNDFDAFGRYAALVFLGLGNVAFFFYDGMMNHIDVLYRKWLYPKIFKRLR